MPVAQSRPDLYLREAGQVGSGGVGDPHVQVIIQDGALGFLQEFIRVQVNGMTNHARVRRLGGGRTI